MNSPTYIGLAGEFKAGKGLVTDVVKAWAKGAGLSAASCRFSDVLRETLEAWNAAFEKRNYAVGDDIYSALNRWHLPVNDNTFDEMLCAFRDLYGSGPAYLPIPVGRENLQKIAVSVDRWCGEGTFTRAVERRLRAVRADIIIVDGVRWISDEQMIRRLPRSEIWYITADEKTRYDRAVAQNEKEGDAAKTFEQFQAEGKAKNEIFIAEIGSRADVKIVNNSNEKKILESLVYPELERLFKR